MFRSNNRDDLPWLVVLLVVLVANTGRLPVGRAAVAAVAAVSSFEYIGYPSLFFHFPHHRLSLTSPLIG